ncbi:MAG TPA: LysR family transcriptional regulator [Steroidobacter sp.]|uniref:LysR family transcriptional regulator n=1 Tax=Steroidobacter sp. TaxID=1978227 RepID=UPI002ED95A43
MQLTLKQLEYFRAVMETGSINGAAKILNVSQPNVSRMIKYTEGRLKLQLFNREKGRVQPTPEAVAIFREVQSLHSHLASLNDFVQRIVTGQTGRFVVGSSPSLGRFIVPSTLARLRRAYPSLPIKLDILSVSQVIEYLVFGQGECACTIFPITHPQIETDAFTAGTLVCAVPRGHPLAQKQRLMAEDIADQPIIGFEPTTPHGEVVESLFAQAGIKPSFLTVARFAESACALAEQGCGIALVDEFTMAGNAFPNLVAVPLERSRSFHIYLHRSVERPLSIFGQRFRDFLAGNHHDNESKRSNGESTKNSKPLVER